MGDPMTTCKTVGVLILLLCLCATCAHDALTPPGTVRSSTDELLSVLTGTTDTDTDTDAVTNDSIDAGKPSVPKSSKVETTVTKVAANPPHFETSVQKAGKALKAKLALIADRELAADKDLVANKKKEKEAAIKTEELAAEMQKEELAAEKDSDEIAADRAETAKLVASFRDRYPLILQKDKNFAQPEKPDDKNSTASEKVEDQVAQAEDALQDTMESARRRHRRWGHVHHRHRPHIHHRHRPHIHHRHRPHAHVPHIHISGQQMLSSIGNAFRYLGNRFRDLYNNFRQMFGSAFKFPRINLAAFSRGFVSAVKQIKTSVANLGRSQGSTCKTDGTWYLPLDMPGQSRTVETPQGCQTRCQRTSGCLYFNSFPNGGCHLSTGTGGTQGGGSNPTAKSGSKACRVAGSGLLDLGVANEVGWTAFGGYAVVKHSQGGLVKPIVDAFCNLIHVFVNPIKQAFNAVMRLITGIIPAWLIRIATFGGVGALASFLFSTFTVGAGWANVYGVTTDAFEVGFALELRSNMQIGATGCYLGGSSGVTAGEVGLASLPEPALAVTAFKQFGNIAGDSATIGLEGDLCKLLGLPCSFAVSASIIWDNTDWTNGNSLALRTFRSCVATGAEYITEIENLEITHEMAVQMVQTMSKEELELNILQAAYNFFRNGFNRLKNCIVNIFNLWIGLGLAVSATAGLTVGAPVTGTFTLDYTYNSQHGG